MKNFVKNLKTYGLLAILMVGGLVITFSAFKAKEVKLEEHSYYFMSNTSLDIKNVSAWSETPVQTCGIDGSLPCEIRISEEQSLNDYLLNTEVEKIIEDAATRKD